MSLMEKSNYDNKDTIFFQISLQSLIRYAIYRVSCSVYILYLLQNKFLKFQAL